MRIFTSDINLFIMTDWDMLIELVENYMRAEGINRSEMARRAGISQSHMTKILDRKSSPGRATCEGIARALDLPAAAIYRAAGFLPPISEYNARRERMDHVIGKALDLPDIEFEKLVKLFDYMIEQQEGENTDEAKSSANPAAKRLGRV